MRSRERTAVVFPTSTPFNTPSTTPSLTASHLSRATEYGTAPPPSPRAGGPSSARRPLFEPRRPQRTSPDAPNECHVRHESRRPLAAEGPRDVPARRSVLQGVGNPAPVPGPRHSGQPAARDAPPEVGAVARFGAAGGSKRRGAPQHPAARRMLRALASVIRMSTLVHLEAGGGGGIARQDDN